MKRQFIMILVALLFIGCSSSSNDSNITKTIEISTKVTNIEDQVLGKKFILDRRHYESKVNIDSYEAPFIVFYGHNMKIDSGCNDIYAKMSVTKDQNISIGELYSTKKICRDDIMVMESMMVKHLNKSIAIYKNKQIIVKKDLLDDLYLNLESK